MMFRFGRFVVFLAISSCILDIFAIFQQFFRKKIRNSQKGLRFPVIPPSQSAVRHKKTDGTHSVAHG